FVGLAGVKPRPGGAFVRQAPDEELVPVDLVRAARRADDMGDALVEKAAKRVLIEPDRPACPGESGEHTCRGEPLHVDDRVITIAADPSQEPPEVGQLAPALVPNKHLLEKGMIRQQGLIPFSDEKIDIRLRKAGVKLLDQSRCQYDVADERSLYDQDFL